MGRISLARLAYASLVGLLAASSVTAQTSGRSPVQDKTFRHPDLDIVNAALAIDRLPPGAAAAAREALAGVGASESNARLDPRGGRFATLLLSHPLIPGSGRGNMLTWSSLGLAAPTSQLASYPSWQPQRSIDHILLSRSISVASAQVLDVGYSDHCPVEVELQLPGDVTLRPALRPVVSVQARAGAVPR